MTDPVPAAGSLPAGIQLAPVDAARWTAATDRAHNETWAARLFDRDSSLWSSDPVVQAGIAETAATNALGTEPTD